MIKKLVTIWGVALIIANAAGCSKEPAQESQVKVGAVKINPHPTALAGKTVVLRWNSKFNGDKFLDRVAELLAQKTPGVKIVKMYQVDPSTAVISGNLDKSLEIATKIAGQKPDLVIAAQAD